jgi:4-amino-4-deoxy-L-arabinose transferase-like glycosyltransferase
VDAPNLPSRQFFVFLRLNETFCPTWHSMKRSYLIAVLVVGIVAIHALFWRLDSLPLQIYDESRLANNALEALDDGHWLQPHYRGKIDLWNTKPPLMVNLQALSMLVVGKTVLGVRLPAALASFALVLLMLFFSRRHLKEAWLGLLAVLILITIPGFNGLHVARTGDYDALLCLWLALSLLFFYRCLSSDPEGRYFRLAMLALAGAVLTKSVAGLLFLPGMLLFAVLDGGLFPFLRKRSTFVSIGLFLVLVLGYYGMREALHPGYLAAVWENEWSGRYLDTLEGHQGGFWFFVEGWWNGRLGNWLYLLPLALIPRRGRKGHFQLFLWVQVFFFWLVISWSGTKLPWYDAPILPLLALLIAGGILELVGVIQRAIAAVVLQRALIVLLLFTFLYPAFIAQYQLIQDPPVNPSVEQRTRYGTFLKHQKDLPPLKIAYPGGNNAQVWFYARAAEPPHLPVSVSEVLPGDMVLVCEEAAITYLQEQFATITTLRTAHGCSMVVIGE